MYCEHPEYGHGQGEEFVFEARGDGDGDIEGDGDGLDGFSGYGSLALNWKYRFGASERREKLFRKTKNIKIKKNVFGYLIN